MAESALKSSTEVAVGLTKKVPIRVLHVDGDVGFLKVAKQSLEMQGDFQVDTALSVKEATKKIRKKTFDAIVCDYRMPEKDGLEFLKELRGKGNKVPFIMFTGKGREEVAIKALSYGADQYISKTGDPETVYTELAHNIRKTLKRNQMEKAFRRSEQEKSAILNSMVEFVVHYERNLRILWVNKAAAESVGLTPEQMVGQHCYEIWYQRSKPCEDCPILKTFKTGQPQEKETTTTDGRVWFLRCYPIKDVDGVVTSVVETVLNITERKKAEESLKTILEKVQVLNEKLHVVGRLTRHDIRNKLSAVTGNVYLAKRKLAGDSEVQKHLIEIESACRQSERILDFAKTYEKLGVEELAYMNVEKSLKEAVTLFSDLHGVKVVNDCRGLTVLADSLLRQIFYNLIDNSLKHGEKVSQIRVYYEEAGKDRLKLVYEDDGIGIPAAEKEKIFREGYGRGTGYGLYLIRKMCEVYGWIIRETGKHGKGAQFTIIMPKMSERESD
jgi:PAS domain S-box-containing protein